MSFKESCNWCKDYLNAMTAGWKPYVEEPINNKDLAEVMMAASIPSFGYFLMMLLSAMIATFGLLQNSAPAIIGAMIIAPLMAPIISLSYSIVILDWQLARRSFLTVIAGVIVVIVFAYLSTQLIGLRIAGSEILSRTSPTLLDLGIAVAAGAAAAFSYTRKSIMSSIAGVAIAVALVPPLTVTGIGLAYGRLASGDAGFSLTELGLYSGGSDIARGAFILFVTNFLGIVLFACLILLTQGYGMWRKAGLGLLITITASIIIIEPLQRSLYKLTVKSEVLSLLVELPQNYPHMYTGSGRVDKINVTYRGDVLHVSIDGVAPIIEEPEWEFDEEVYEDNYLDRLQKVTDLFHQHLVERLNAPVTLEVDIVPLEVLSASSGGEHRDPAGFESPEKVEEEKEEAEFQEKADEIEQELKEENRTQKSPSDKNSKKKFFPLFD